MRLVDCDRRDIPGLQVLLPVVQHQPLRRDVEQPPLAAVQSGQARARLRPRQAGVEIRRGHAGRLELVDLVLHQRDQRRDDDGQADPMQGRHLEAKRLPAAGRKQGKDIAARQARLDDLPLERAEFRIAEGGVEGLEQFRQGVRRVCDDSVARTVRTSMKKRSTHLYPSFLKKRGCGNPAGRYVSGLPNPLTL